jgi:hypothetical protein
MPSTFRLLLDQSFILTDTLLPPALLMTFTIKLRRLLWIRLVAQALIHVQDLQGRGSDLPHCMEEESPVGPRATRPLPASFAHCSPLALRPQLL